MKPTIQDAIRLIADTYGLTFAEATALLRVPLHPHGLRDEFAGLALSAWGGYNHNAGSVASRVYEVADAMLSERVRGVK